MQNELTHTLPALGSCEPEPHHGIPYVWGGGLTQGMSETHFSLSKQADRNGHWGKP